MKTVSVQLEADEKGEVAVRVPLGPDEALRRVRVTVTTDPEPADPAPQMSQEEWARVVDEAFGSCADLGLERPDQGEAEKRDPIR